jgi:hypothetical protein
MTFRRAAIGAPLLLLLLTGCVPVAEPEPGASGSPSPTITSTATPSATPTVTPTPGPETEPVSFGCDDLVSAQVLYDYNPNVSLLSSFSPPEGSLAGQALAQQGIACEIVNQTSGATIDIGVVSYTETAYAAKAAALSSTATATDAFDGFFDVTEDGGVGQVLYSPYWVTITSADFTAAEDAAALVNAAVAALG